MDEKKELNKDPKFIELIEEILDSLITFILNFPYIAFVILLRPSRIFGQEFKIKPLTYFSVSLLVSSAFWHSWFLPDESFISPVVIYLVDPNINEIKDYFFDTDSLTKALISLIPIILFTHVVIRIIALFFKARGRFCEMLRFFFYFLGLILIGVPVIFF